MQRGGKFSLAAALFGWPPAPGHSAPDQEIPDAWVLLFREQHAATDPGVLRGMFCSCTAGRDSALEAAPQVTVKLDTTTNSSTEQAPAAAKADTTASAVSPREPRAVWCRRVKVLGSTLQARGPLPTCLRLTSNGSVQSSIQCALVPGLLQAAQSAVSQLVLRHRCRGGDHSADFSGPLHFIAASAPQITRLKLSCWCFTLPHPSFLPQLRLLSVDLSQAVIWDDGDYEVEDTSVALRSISPYLPQLTHLTILQEDFQIVGPTDWGWLVESGHSAANLTHLTTNAECTDQLLTGLLDHAPALRELRVGPLQQIADHGAYRERRWGVEQMRLGYAGVDVGLLAALPRSTADSVCYVMDWLNVKPAGVEGFAPDIRALLPTWRIQADAILLSANADLLPHEQPTALRNTLAQLGSGCLAAGVPLRLLEWPSTAGMMQALAECVPALAQLGNTVTYNIDGPLTDDALSAVVSVGQIRHKFIAKGLALQSDQHASAPWPWGEITISRLDMPDLCKLPNPAGQGAPRKVSCSSVVLDNTLMQDQQATVLGRLQHIALHGLWKVTFVGTETLTADSLTTQLSLLSAVRYTASDSHNTTVTLQGWTVTSDIVTALHGLPHMSGTLKFVACAWPSEPAVCAQLAHTVPMSYREWVLAGITQAIFECIAAALRQRRKGLGLGPLEMVWYEGLIDESEPHEHVIDADGE